ncbi:hypothetical protein LTR84_007515 [Exophiala bonariae]|uniref:Uncharacterized protein n=1 Tax=Exophiala bonariae TaxID=1690606 RepID=A0AAV9N1Q4_9EURO|nr:hypothetical protein LTR84_007515 [Exophiala bonariae]
MESQEAGQIPYGSSVIRSNAVDVSLPINYKNIAGKTILITGGASGFGAACFQQWANHGANVIIGDVNAQAGTELVARIRKETGNANHHFLSLDVSSWPSQAAFFKQAAKLSPHGGIDHVMANAGITSVPEEGSFQDPPDYATMEDPPAPVHRTLDINLTGVVYTTHLAIAYLSRNPGSRNCSVDEHTAPRDRHLILVSSLAGLSGLPSLPFYATAKHGVVGLFRTLRITGALKSGIRVNMINPYFVETPLLGIDGALVMAGGAMAKIEDVIEATTRLVADQGIIGRALVIGFRGPSSVAKAAGLQPVVADQAIWDVYAHDFEQSDVFVRRIIGVTNLIATARGWVGVISDVGAKLSRPFWKVLGY